MFYLYYLSLLLLPFFASGISYSAPVVNKLYVVTTLPVLKDIAENIGQEFISVESLAEPNQDAHFVQPKPTFMKKVSKADVFIEVGLSLELWGQKIIDSVGNVRIQIGQPGRVVVSSGVSTLEIPQILSRDFGDVHPQGNPHIWLDPLNIKKIAENIKIGLASVDPAHEAIYAKNLLKYQNQIDVALFGEKLVSEIGSKKLTRLCEQDELFSFLKKKNLEKTLGGWLKKAMPIRGKQIVTYHRTWGYLANRLGFTVPVEIEDKPGIPPSAKHRDQVVAAIKRQKIPVILMEIFYDRFPAAEAIAKQTGASIVQVPIDVGALKSAATYFELMNYILDQLLASNKF
jgi:zinc/manganese transport system substrate-binding protein